MDFHFANQLGWYAFISLLVLILLYLIRPKPKDTTIPSLMFFIKSSGMTKQNSFLRNLMNNLLFLLQFLALSLIAFALTYPFINVPKESVQQNTVIVLDVSASMQAQENGISRFETALSRAREQVASSTSIVLASNIPIVALDQGNKERALNILSSVQAKDTSSNVGDSMLMAGSILGNKGKVVIISDMKTTDGLDIEAAKKALVSRGLDVELIDVGERGDNTGIVELEITKREVRAFVKNFGDNSKSITLIHTGNEKTVRQERVVLAHSLELFTFEMQAGLSTIEIEQDDALEVDNKVYIAGPTSKRIRVLLVTNAESGSIRTALESSPDIELKIAEPPVIPDLDYDVIVLNKFTNDLILPGFFEDLSDRVAKGTNVIITAQPGLEKVNFELMPVKATILVQNETEILKTIDNQFTSDIDFGRTTQYYKATLQESTMLLSSTDNTPMLALRDEKEGSVLYYGIFDEASDFKSSVSYPLFWNKAVNYLYNSQDLGELNTKTDKILPIEEQKVQTPQGAIETNRLFFDKAGFYTLGEKKISANLLNEKESDLTSAQVSEPVTGGPTKTEEEMVRQSFVTLLSACALLFIFAELLLAKIRGDL